MNTTPSVPCDTASATLHPDANGTEKNAAIGAAVTTPAAAPPTPTRPHRRWSDAERVAALAALKANGGDMARTSAETGVPKQTLWNWTHSGPGAKALDLAKQEAFEKELADRLEEFAHKLIAAAVGKLEKASFKDCMIGMGIAVDKMQLLRNKPTEIVEQPTKQPNYENLTTEQLERLQELGIEANAIIASAAKGPGATATSAA